VSSIAHDDDASAIESPYQRRTFNTRLHFQMSGEGQKFKLSKDNIKKTINVEFL
jgi:hypothetical protein